MRTASVGGGPEALALLRLENSGPDPFHLAVLDGQMPGMDGLELARHIKSDPRIAATRLILLSSLGDHLTDETLSAAGIEDYLIKPLKQTRLEAALAALFRRKPFPVANVAPSPTRSASADCPLHILVAEDNLVNQKVALLQLKSLGYTADIANDGIEALKALEAVPYDVILMDCQMPNMDGYAATREIRRIHTRPILIVAMTASAMRGDREKCLAAGMDDHISKPVNCVRLGRLLSDHKRAATVPPALVPA